MELLVNEIWRDIPGHDGRYRVSSIGNVMSVGHIIVDSAGRTRVFHDKILSPCYGKNPRHAYANVCLSRPDGTQQRVRVHRLVAEAFIPNPDNLPQVNHKDGNKANNKIENLEWRTIRENLLHAFRTGLHPNEKFEKEAGRRAVIVENQYGESMRFDSVSAAAAYMGYKYPSHLSRDLHVRGGKCRNGYFAYREDGKRN